MTKNKSKGKDDPLYPQIKQWVIERNGDVVTADILRIVKRGYMRTARIMDQLIEDGIVKKDYKRQEDQSSFGYPEDYDFFCKILGKDAIGKALFDFRDPKIKREEFNRDRNDLLERQLLISEEICHLKLVDCGGKLVLDHIIPLSSNELNKNLRKMRSENGKKVPTQSLGSNNSENLILACENCNNYKKHRFVKKDENDNYTIVDFSHEK